MPQGELPTWIERFLTFGSYNCSEPEYTRFRQRLLRESVLEIADAHEQGRGHLHDGCVRHLAHSDTKVVLNAVSCLFVIGTVADVPAIETLVQHPSEAVRKAARTCVFEIRRRPPGTEPT